mgnify:CR=1 FL=1
MSSTLVSIIVPVYNSETFLKEFVDNHYMSIKKELKTLSKSVSDQTIQIKLNEITNLIKPLDKNQNVKDDDLTSLLQYHQLIAELKLTK